MLNDVVKLAENEGILVSFSIGHVVYFGDIDNLQYKIELLKGIWEKEENPAYIDLHNLETIITKPVWGMMPENKNKDEENVVDESDEENKANEQIRGAEVEE